jgi:ribonuclease M5
VEKLKLTQAVIVEGKYDKIKLEALIDGVILTTNGFRIFKDKEMQRLIRTLAKTCGIVVLTDSDKAGFEIRALLSGIVWEGEIINVYIPDILGKEKRKRKPSAERKLGVEGMELAVLKEAFLRCGVTAKKGNLKTARITRMDLYEDGLCGGENSADLRRGLYQKLGLPARLSTGAAIPLLNQILTLEEYKQEVENLKSINIQQSTDNS